MLRSHSDMLRATCGCLSVFCVGVRTDVHLEERVETVICRIFSQHIWIYPVFMQDCFSPVFFFFNFAQSSADLGILKPFTIEQRCPASQLVETQPQFNNELRSTGGPDLAARCIPPCLVFLMLEWNHWRCVM